MDGEPANVEKDTPDEEPNVLDGLPQILEIDEKLLLNSDDDSADVPQEDSLTKNWTDNEYAGDYFVNSDVFSIHSRRQEASFSEEQLLKVDNPRITDVLSSEKVDYNENEFAAEDEEARLTEGKEEKTTDDFMDDNAAEALAPGMDEKDDRMKMDPTKCSTESRFKEERIWARRHKIRTFRNVDNDNKDFEPQDLKDQDLGIANSQIERSDKKLFTVFEDGESEINSFLVGAQKRYSMRRSHMYSELERIQIMLEEEQELFKVEYEKILSRWPEIETIKGPHRLYDFLCEQKAAVEERVQIKNRVIHRIQQALKQVDEHYAKTLKKHEQDITDLTTAQSAAFKNLLSAYLNEMHVVQEALYEDLAELRDKCNTEFETLRTKKSDSEFDVMKRREKLKEDFENELDALRWNESEKFTELKRKLETDVHTIEQQLMLMKAGFQMNAEKLEYNYQVLKRRDEENTVTRSKQKRKVTKLQDSLTKLREKYRRQEQRHDHEIEGLAEDCRRLAQQIVELHNKGKHFQKSDSSQFRDVWIVEEIEIRKVLRTFLDEDRLITEQILGNEWILPDLSFLQEIGPINARKWKSNYEEIMTRGVDFERPLEAEVFEKSRKCFEELCEEEKSLTFYTATKTKKEVRNTDKLESMDPLLLARTFEIITDEAGFLMENKLLEIIHTFDDDTRRLVKFDSILRGLGISTRLEIIQLIEYFMQEIPANSFVKPEDEKIEAAGDAPAADEKSSDRVASLADDNPDYMKLSDSETDILQSKLLISLIPLDDVILVLKKFVDDYHDLAYRRRARLEDQQKAIQARDDIYDKHYFEQYVLVKDLFEKKIVWQELYKHMYEYYSMLVKRYKSLDQESKESKEYSNLLTRLGEDMTSKQATSLLIPPLTSLMAKQDKLKGHQGINARRSMQLKKELKELMKN